MIGLPLGFGDLLEYVLELDLISNPATVFAPSVQQEALPPLMQLGVVFEPTIRQSWIPTTFITIDLLNQVTGGTSTTVIVAEALNSGGRP